MMQGIGLAQVALGAWLWTYSEGFSLLLGSTVSYSSPAIVNIKHNYYML